MEKIKITLQQLLEYHHLDREFVSHCVTCEWIEPSQRRDEIDQTQFDEEDVARMRLILELRRDFEVNDPAMPIILHLLDQLHGLRRQIREAVNHSDDRRDASQDQVG